MVVRVLADRAVACRLADGLSERVCLKHLHDDLQSDKRFNGRRKVFFPIIPTPPFPPSSKLNANAFEIQRFKKKIAASSSRLINIEVWGRGVDGGWEE